MQGISFNKRRKLWQARVFAGKKSISLGYFQSEIEAGRAADYGLEYVGRKKVNFPSDPIPRKIIELVRPKLVAWRKSQLFERTKEQVHSCVWYWGYAPGEQWANGRLSIAAELAISEQCDPGEAIDRIGIRREFEDLVELQPSEFRNARTFAAKQAVWLAGFLRGAKDRVEKNNLRRFEGDRNEEFDFSSIL